MFSTLLNWLLEHHHGLVLSAMVGLMVGSARRVSSGRLTMWWCRWCWCSWPSPW
ncbi:MAG: hypothetical protein ACPGCX_10525 [Ilumatobacteraceae bacterium]